MRVIGLPVALLASVACSRAQQPSSSQSAAVSSAAVPVTSALAAAPAASANTGEVIPFRVVTKERIPKEVRVAGTLTKVIVWTDKNGENLAVFSQRTAKSKEGKPLVGDDGPFESGYLAVQHVLLGAPPKVLRELKDKEEGCDADLSVEFRDAALAVTDLDHDGIGELTFAYSLNCASDLSPARLKLAMLENGDKFMLRGSTRVAGGGEPASGGTFVVDSSFKEAPAGFLEHAKASWLKVRAH